MNAFLVVFRHKYCHRLGDGKCLLCRSQSASIRFLYLRWALLPWVFHRQPWPSARAGSSSQTRVKFSDVHIFQLLVCFLVSSLMFWADWGKKPRIERAGLDGSNRKMLFDTKISLPVSMAMDYVREELYWGDNDYHVIERSDLDGNRRWNIDILGKIHWKIKTYVNH